MPRGLSLPPEAIKFYEERQTDQEMFRFNGFTSTSLSKEIATNFAHQYLKEGQVPVIFEIYLDEFYSGSGIQYLNSNDLSAFPYE